MPWWIEGILGIILILGPLSQMKNLGQTSYKSGPNWGKSSPWALPLLIVYLVLIFLGTILCLFAWSGAYSAFNSLF